MSPAATAAVVLLAAFALDLAAGDPPNRWHPVAWMGGALGAGRGLMHGSPARLFLAGGALVLAVSALAALAAWGLVRLTGPWGVAGVVVEAVALKSLLSVRGLLAAAGLVGARLGQGDLVAARAALAEHLVSRPTAALDAPRVASGAIESVAENLTDAVVAPALFYLLFGLPGAAVYRVINTADAMFGYRDGPLEYFGKAAARLDDALNLLPARLAGLAIVGASALGGGSARAAWRTLRRDARATPSPNAGWPMAAIAGALGLTLEKPATYTLGAGRSPGARDVARAVRVTAVASILAVGVLIAASLVVERALHN